MIVGRPNLAAEPPNCRRRRSVRAGPGGSRPSWSAVAVAGTRTPPVGPPVTTGARLHLWLDVRAGHRSARDPRRLAVLVDSALRSSFTWTSSNWDDANPLSVRSWQSSRLEARPCSCRVDHRERGEAGVARAAAMVVMWWLSAFSDSSTVTEDWGNHPPGDRDVTDGLPTTAVRNVPGLPTTSPSTPRGLDDAVGPAKRRPRRKRACRRSHDQHPVRPGRRAHRCPRPPGRHVPRSARATTPSTTPKRPTPRRAARPGAYRRQVDASAHRRRSELAADIGTKVSLLFPRARTVPHRPAASGRRGLPRLIGDVGHRPPRVIR